MWYCDPCYALLIFRATSFSRGYENNTTFELMHKIRFTISLYLSRQAYVNEFSLQIILFVVFIKNLFSRNSIKRKERGGGREITFQK